VILRQLAKKAHFAESHTPDARHLQKRMALVKAAFARPGRSANSRQSVARNSASTAQFPPIIPELEPILPDFFHILDLSARFTRPLH
jgi:hypothetical protein